MIKIDTVGDHRNYCVPAALVDVAVMIFKLAPRDALFSLARRISADDLHTTERLAINYSIEEAAAFARDRLVVLPRSTTPV